MESVVGLHLDPAPVAGVVVPVDAASREDRQQPVGDVARLRRMVVVAFGQHGAQHRAAGAQHIHRVGGGRDLLPARPLAARAARACTSSFCLYRSSSVAHWAALRGPAGRPLLQRWRARPGRGYRSRGNAARCHWTPTVQMAVWPASNARQRHRFLLRRAALVLLLVSAHSCFSFANNSSSFCS